MTVSSSTNRVSYAGNGSTTVFPYTYKVFDEDDLTVILRSADGTETVKTITSDYTVSGVGNAGGGNVTMLTAPATGETLVILREQDLVQELDIVPNDPFPADSLEGALDRLTFMVQQHEEALGRTIKASRTNTISGSEFTISAADRASKIFAFDSSGDLSIAQELGTYRGDWATGTAYAERDIVKDGGNDNLYFCNTAHTSSGSVPISTNTDTAKWGLLLDVSAFSDLYDQFDDRYLGAKSSDPATDNDGNALIDGALYWNTTDNRMKVYDLGNTTWAFTAPTAAEQANIDAVAAIAADVSTVAGIDTDVTTVAGISSDVTTVATNVADITNFSDVYLGPKASDPATRNDTSALQAGDLYFNTTSDTVRVYTGSAWEAAAASTSGLVEKTSATGSAIVPTGTDAQRDGTPSAGYFRFNTDSSSFEGYDGTAWGAVGGSADLSAVAEDILPDADSTRDIGSTSNRWAQGWFDDVTAGTADINGGTIDGTVIGGSTPAAISGTDITLSGGVYLGGTGAANYLDDYEEGTFSPTILGTSSNPTVTYGSQSGKYLKVGSLVWVSVDFNTTAVSGGSGSALLGNLPFTSTGSVYGQLNGGLVNVDIDNAVVNLTARVAGSNSTALFQVYRDNTSDTNVLVSDLSGGTKFYQFSGCYSTQ